jgi:hypothetical protein
VVRPLRVVRQRAASQGAAARAHRECQLRSRAWATSLRKSQRKQDPLWSQAWKRSRIWVPASSSV